MLGCLFAAVGGCASVDEEATVGKSQKLADENAALRQEISELEAENERLERQAAELLGLEGEAELVGLVGVDRIELTDRTGLYDEDGDGVKETVFVYLRPIDTVGDIVKMPGRVRVRLLDLGRGPGKMLLAEKVFSREELKRLWVGTFLTDYYKLTMKAGEGISGENELTVKADFTHAITGQLCSEQKVIKP